MKHTLIFGLFSILYTVPAAAQVDSVATEEARWIGNNIFRNECAGQLDCLTTWNAGEQFASLGIGHFIWYPKGQDGPFRESFPALLTCLKKQGVTLPEWLTPNSDCPWSSRQDFLSDIDSERMQELRTFLQTTIPQQTEFLLARLQASLSEILRHVPESQHESLINKFRILMQSPAGRYALTDYVNFKGEGTLITERYDGQGWGLLQVLQQMDTADNTTDAVAEFAAAAKKVLTRRVENAPAERNERKWLNGWLRRINTYTETADTP